MPPSTYPSASPYAALSKYFAKLIRLRIITRALLKELLYTQHGDSVDFSDVKYRHRHRSQMTLRINKHGGLDSSDSDSETDSDSEEDGSSSADEYFLIGPSTDHNNGKMQRQNAMDKSSFSSEASGCSNNAFDYKIYHNSASKESGLNENSSPIDCTHEIFQGVDQLRREMSTDSNETYPKIRISKNPSSEDSGNTTRAPLGTVLQYSECSDNSSFECGKSRAYMACEDLVNLDQNLIIETMGHKPYNNYNPMRQSCPTKFVANKFNVSSMTAVCTPGWQFSSEHALSKESDTSQDDKIVIRKSPSQTKRQSSCDCSDAIEHSISSEIIQNLAPPDYSISNSESTSSDMSQETVINKIIIDPPPMFRNDENINSTPRISSFEKHLLNSDKILRKSTKSLEHSVKESSLPLAVMRMIDKTTVTRQCVSCHIPVSLPDCSPEQTNCDCCNHSRCHTPRSSDSGVAGSCNLASPEFPHRIDSLYSHCDTQSLNEKAYNKSLHNDYSMSTGDLNRFNEGRISDLDAAKFEEQCPITSPFSTPRTSSQPISITSENRITGVLDSTETVVTHSCSQSIPCPSQDKPKLYRKPSRHNTDPRNVRHIFSHGYSTPNISVLPKQSNHYHLRIYREEPSPSVRPSRQRAAEAPSASSRSPRNEITRKEKRIRSKSEDLEKKYNFSRAEHVIYRSDLYAHWWMKAKLPITVIASGKDIEFLSTASLSCPCLLITRMLLFFLVFYLPLNRFSDLQSQCFVYRSILACVELLALLT